MTKRMERRDNTMSMVIDAAAWLSDAFDMSIYAGGILRMPAAWTAASVGFHVSDSEEGTYLPLYDDDGTLVQIDNPLVSRAYSMPPEIECCLFVKLWSQNGSGTNTVQAAERALGVDLKS